MSSKPDPRETKRRSSPSWSGYRPASELSSRIKQRNRKTGTKAELALRHALWRRGLRYRLNRRDLPGTPDLVFTSRRVVVFVDGDFWHGRNWNERKERLGSGNNGAYWVSKIAYNRDQDQRHNARLAELGWRVMRLWETDVLRDPEAAAGLVATIIRSDDRAIAPAASIALRKDSPETSGC
ncbi:MAG: very short patch repair endonuclease [Chromatiaceae bacterium]|nr:very short patch repair endonuclease [Chromatiaceae bacterium]